MTFGEFMEALSLMNSQRPFRRYEIGFTSGDRVTVIHPEAIRRIRDLTVFQYSGTDRSHRSWRARLAGSCRRTRCTLLPASPAADTAARRGPAGH